MCKVSPPGATKTSHPMSRTFSSIHSTEGAFVQEGLSVMVHASNTFDAST
jgi:hypothetical protein